MLVGFHTTSSLIGRVLHFSAGDFILVGEFCAGDRDGGIVDEFAGPVVADDGVEFAERVVVGVAVVLGW